MSLYTRPQLTLLLLLLGAAAIGLGVVHWRAAHPELVERLERLDRDLLAAGEPPTVEASARHGGESWTRRDGERGRRRDRESTAETRRSAAERSPASPPARRPKLPSPTLDTAPVPLDLNRATLPELIELPGVGPVLARRILETREALGRFGAVDDLVTVRGVGQSKLERLRPFFSVLE